MLEGFLTVLALTVFFLLLPCRYDPAIRLKYRQMGLRWKDHNP